jgi:hypothetical protein
VEHGHVTPTIDTTEKIASALEVPLYRLFYEGDKPPNMPNLLRRKSPDETAWGNTGGRRKISSCAPSSVRPDERRKPQADFAHGGDNGIPGLNIALDFICDK